MNLTKYFMLKLPMDDSFGPTDMPSIWNLKKYDSPTNRMNWAGDSHDAYSVIIDSALGLIGSESGPKDKAAFLQPDRLAEGLPAQQAAAEVSVRCRRDESDCGQGDLRPAVRDVPCERQHRHAAAARRRRHQSRPHRYVGQGLRGRGQQGRRRHGHRAQGARRSAADRLQRRSTSTASGCARRICTTARCRHCATCSSPSTSDRKSSTAATTFTIRFAAGSYRQAPTREREGTRFDVSQRGNGNGGHAFGVTLPTRTRMRSSNT